MVCYYIFILQEVFAIFNDRMEATSSDRKVFLLKIINVDSLGDKFVLWTQEVPSLEYIYKFLKAVSDIAQYSSECNIIALVFFIIF